MAWIGVGIVSGIALPLGQCWFFLPVDLRERG